MEKLSAYILLLIKKLKMKVVFGFIIICFSSCLYAQQINCDSLKMQFDIEINEAKKNGADKTLLQQLEMLKKQTIEMFCNGTTKGATNNSSKISNATINSNNQKKDAESYSEKNFSTKLLPPVNFISASKITIQVKANSTETNETVVYDYYINKEGNEMLIDKSGLEKAGKLYEMGEGESSEFIAWLIESNGKNTVYTISKEDGKMALANNLSNSLFKEKTKMYFKELSGTKNIAGFICKGFTASGLDNGEKINLNCWTTITPLQIKHSTFPMFSMFNANAIGFPVAPNCGILKIEGTIGNDKINVEVKSIQKSNKRFDFVGYKTISIRN